MGKETQRTLNLGTQYIDWKNFEISAVEASEFLGISEGMLAKLIKSGAPKAGRGRYNLQAIVRWYMERKGIDDEDIRRALWRAQKEAIDIQNASSRGELLPVPDVEHFASELSTILTGGLDALPARASPELVNCTEIRQAQAIIEREARDLRTAILRCSESFADRLARGGNSKTAAKGNGRQLGRSKTRVASRKPRARSVAKH